MSDTATQGRDNDEAAAGPVDTQPTKPRGGTPARRPVGVIRVRSERFALYASALLAIAVPTVTVLDVHFPGRPLLAVLFVLTVPGVPLASLLRVRDALLTSSLAVGISLAFALLTGTAALVAGWWSPLGWAVALAVVHVAATGWALPRLARQEIAAPYPRASHTGLTWNRLCSAVVLLAALLLWWLAAHWVNLDVSSAYGVIGVAGWPYFLAIALVAGVVAAQLLRRKFDPFVLAAATLVLTFVIFAFVNVADGEASVATGWLHVGFARFIDLHHSSFTGLDARADWPGFFAATAQLVKLAGVGDASVFLRLAPFFYNAAAIVPLLIIAGYVTRSRRVAWLAVIVYLVSNWFQQDYFSPQATAFLLYLVLLATLLWSADNATVEPLRGGRWARAVSAWRRVPSLPSDTTPGESLAREAALVLIGAAIVVSHQLTPVALVITLLVFVLTGYTRYRRLWLVIALLFVAWFSYGATDFWAGHLKTVFGDIGRLGANLNSGVASRVAGNPTYQLMQDVRLGWSLLYVILGLLGLWAIRRRPEALLVSLLGLSAAGLVLLQSYGGEIVLRVFVYASPILAPLAAVTLRRVVASPRYAHKGVAGAGLSGRRLILTAAVTVVLAVAGLIGTATRGVNVSFERVTQDDVAAAQVLWANLKQGDKVGYLFPAGAYGANRFGDWSSVALDQSSCGSPPLRCAIDTTPRFILLSRSQDAAEHLLAGRGQETATSIGPPLVARHLYTVLYQGKDAELLMLVPHGG